MSQFVKYISSFGNRAFAHTPEPVFPAQLGSGDMMSYLLTLTPDQQLRFAVDQALCISYFAWLNGPRASEFLIAYTEWLKWLINSKLSTYKFDSMYQEVYEDCVRISASWLGGRWEDVNIGVIKVLVYDPLIGDRELPLALDLNSAIPYMMYRNKEVQPGFEVWNGMFAIPTCINITYFGACYFCNRPIGRNFSAKITDSDAAVAGARNTWISNGFPILDLLYHIDLTGTDFETVLSVIASLVFTEDPYRELSRNHGLFYVTSRILNTLFSVDFLDISRQGNVFVLDKPAIKSSTASGLARTLMTFLAALNKRYGVQMRSRELKLSSTLKRLEVTKLPPLSLSWLTSVACSVVARQLT